jgi:hypothetical protein
MSAHKKLIGEKLAEEEAERKFKGEAKKEKQLVKSVSKPSAMTSLCVFLMSLVAYELLYVNIVGRKGTCETC